MCIVFWTTLFWFMYLLVLEEICLLCCVYILDVDMRN